MVSVCPAHAGPDLQARIAREPDETSPLEEPQVVMRDRLTGKPRGFGFVTFKDKDAAERVCQEPQVLDGRQVCISTVTATRISEHSQRTEVA